MEWTRHAARMEATELNQHFWTNRCKGDATDVDWKMAFQQIRSIKHRMKSSDSKQRPAVD